MDREIHNIEDFADDVPGRRALIDYIKGSGKGTLEKDIFAPMRDTSLDDATLADWVRDSDEALSVFSDGVSLQQKLDTTNGDPSLPPGEEIFSDIAPNTIYPNFVLPTVPCTLSPDLGDFSKMYGLGWRMTRAPAAAWTSGGRSIIALTPQLITAASQDFSIDSDGANVSFDVFSAADLAEGASANSGFLVLPLDEDYVTSFESIFGFAQSVSSQLTTAEWIADIATAESLSALATASATWTDWTLVCPTEQQVLGGFPSTIEGTISAQGRVGTAATVELYFDGADGWPVSDDPGSSAAYSRLHVLVVPLVEIATADAPAPEALHEFSLIPTGTVELIGRYFENGAWFDLAGSFPVLTTVFVEWESSETTPGEATTTKTALDPGGVSREVSNSTVFDTFGPFSELIIQEQYGGLPLLVTPWATVDATATVNGVPASATVSKSSLPVRPILTWM